jgi:SAM-dependent methyltransferase
MADRWFTTRAKESEVYTGILVHADAGVHSEVAELVSSIAGRGARVLDVGAGEGALTKRLLDAGYAVSAVEADVSQWRVPEVEPVVVDVQQPFAAELEATFPVVVCVEVAEHIENPWHLLRELYAVTEPGGTLILSTPNVQSFLSRLMFLRSGRLHQFEDADLSYGHIRPITDAELRLAADRAGWRDVVSRPAGELPVFDLSPRTVRSLVMNAFRGIAYAVSKGPKRGWCLLYRMRKPG